MESKSISGRYRELVKSQEVTASIALVLPYNLFREKWIFKKDLLVTLPRDYREPSSDVAVQELVVAYYGPDPELNPRSASARFSAVLVVERTLDTSMLGIPSTPASSLQYAFNPCDTCILNRVLGAHPVDTFGDEGVEGEGAEATTRRWGSGYGRKLETLTRNYSRTVTLLPSHLARRRVRVLAAWYSRVQAADDAQEDDEDDASRGPRMMRLPTARMWRRRRPRGCRLKPGWGLDEDKLAVSILLRVDLYRNTRHTGDDTDIGALYRHPRAGCCATHPPPRSAQEFPRRLLLQPPASPAPLNRLLTAANTRVCASSTSVVSLARALVVLDASRCEPHSQHAHHGPPIRRVGPRIFDDKDKVADDGAEGEGVEEDDACGVLDMDDRPRGNDIRTQRVKLLRVGTSDGGDILEDPNAAQESEYTCHTYGIHGNDLLEHQAKLHSSPTVWCCTRWRQRACLSWGGEVNLKGRGRGPQRDSATRRAGGLSRLLGALRTLHPQLKQHVRGRDRLRKAGAGGQAKENSLALKFAEHRVAHAPGPPAGRAPARISPQASARPSSTTPEVGTWHALRDCPLSSFGSFTWVATAAARTARVVATMGTTICPPKGPDSGRAQAMAEDVEEGLGEHLRAS
ncbi:hypothetical protein C8R46DRAFT_1048085 [Mycena filopes]|nr:hypothetical protein C8R46DRAFT_1048085 [Mycena filopes]